MAQKETETEKAEKELTNEVLSRLYRSCRRAALGLGHVVGRFIIQSRFQIPPPRIAHPPLTPPSLSQSHRTVTTVVMVLKTQTCRFSGLKIYPGKGMLYIRTDGQQFLFLKQKCKALFNQRKRPAKLAWTSTYRKQHRKDVDIAVARKKRRGNARNLNRSVAGVSLEVIKSKRQEKPEARKAGRDAALREIKERSKKSKSEKKAQKDAARAQQSRMR